MVKQLTKKQVQEYYNNIISVGYCDIQFLLQGMEREGYTAGIYGWNADIYEIDKTTAIVTGYRPFGNISSNEKGLNKKYNEKARTISNNLDLTWEQKKNKLNKLLQKYVKEVIESEAK